MNSLLVIVLLNSMLSYRTKASDKNSKFYVMRKSIVRLKRHSRNHCFIIFTADKRLV